MKHLTAIIVGAALLLGLAILAGCELQADKSEDLLPTRGYGTFKISVDDVGPYEETDETGNVTGRKGFWYDVDQDSVPEQFYQLNKPSGGIISLSFSQETGYADGGLPTAMARFRPGQSTYEIPLESLTSWIKSDVAIGYKAAQYVDQPDILVYMDRVNQIESEAPLTGNREVFNMQMYVAGEVAPEASASTLSRDDGQSEPQADGDDDINLLAFGGVDAGCENFAKICETEEKCGDIFAAEWSVADCKQRLYNMQAEAEGKRYYNCLKVCRSKYKDDCQALQGCRIECIATNLEDVFGCPGKYGPDILDVIYLVKREGQVYKTDSGFTILEGDQLAVFVEYHDVDGDFGYSEEIPDARGQMVVTLNGTATTINIPREVGYSSMDDKAFLGFAVTGPVPAGDYTLTIQLIDAGCANAGNIANGAFSSEGQTKDPGSFGVGNLGNLSFEMFEIFDTGLNKYNLGKGFIDIRSISLDPNLNYLYELYNFDIAVVQAYVWSFINTDKFSGLTFDDINKLIFTTTHDTRGTKFDESDDIQAMAFYIDQAMSSGLFTFYGDEGWNIYPKAPYGDNEDQPFIKGDFENTTIHLPFQPIEVVSLQYTGCADTCEYWVNYIYDPPVGKQIRGFANRDEAIADCKNHSADDFWRGLFMCYKKAAAGINGCESLNACLDAVPPSSGGAGTICDSADNLELKIRVNIDEKYLQNETYRKVLENADGTLKLGLYAGSAADNLWHLIPGGFVTYNMGQSEYLVPLPYMPLVPNEFIQISQADGAVQSQIYIALVQQTEDYNVVYGTGFYPANDDVDGEWFYLLVYTYNWADPQQEGWALGPVSGNSIYGWVNLLEPIIDINFGDARATGGSVLQP